MSDETDYKKLYLSAVKQRKDFREALKKSRNETNALQSKIDKIKNQLASEAILISKIEGDTSFHDSVLMMLSANNEALDMLLEKINE